eukprot:865617-Pyramimonas_sp.AAC.1
MGGAPIYMCPVGEADVSRDEPAQDKISRLQKTLRGAFNGAWGAWVRRAAARQRSYGAKLDPNKFRTAVQRVPPGMEQSRI